MARGPTRSGFSGTFVQVDNFKKLVIALNSLTGNEVMVGVPAEKAGRRDGPITNAALAYIHDKGSPAAHIPPRPFMEPGIKSVQDKITAEFELAAEAAFDGKPEDVLKRFNRAGIIAQNGIKAKISSGIPPPLAPSTIRGRIGRLKNKKRRASIKAAIAAGQPTSVQAGYEEYMPGLFTPLIVTGQLRNAITYVIRKITGKKVK